MRAGVPPLSSTFILACLRGRPPELEWHARGGERSSSTDGSARGVAAVVGSPATQKPRGGMPAQSLLAGRPP